jgi:hypothetical protein
MAEAQVSHRGECPACGMPVPFLKTQWGLGSRFQCLQCGRSLIIEKAKPLAAIGLYIALTLWARATGFWIVVALLVVGSLLTWQFSTVRLAKQAD